MIPLKLEEIEKAAMEHLTCQCDEAHAHRWWCFRPNTEAEEGWLHALRLALDLMQTRASVRELAARLHLVG